MNKFFQRFTFSFLLFLTIGIPAVPAYAQQFSLVPRTELSYDDCKKKMAEFEASSNQSSLLTAENRNDTLGCAIKTGRITFSMVPYFITYITNFLLGMSGIICLLFIVIGGYHYVVGGLTDEKENGKNTIKHALMGMGVALLSWSIVSVIINAITG